MMMATSSLPACCFVFYLCCINAKMALHLKALDNRPISPLLPTPAAAATTIPLGAVVAFSAAVTLL